MMLGKLSPTEIYSQPNKNRLFWFFFKLQTVEIPVICVAKTEFVSKLINVVFFFQSRGWQGG